MAAGSKLIIARCGPEISLGLEVTTGKLAGKRNKKRSQAQRKFGTGI
jgi:hypothetical protein